MRIKICRKEAKESKYWLGLLSDVPAMAGSEHKRLAKEAAELLSIFGAIVQKLRT